MKYSAPCTLACLLVLPLFTSCVDDATTGSGSDPATATGAEPERTSDDARESLNEADHEVTGPHESGSAATQPEPDAPPKAHTVSEVGAPAQPATPEPEPSRDDLGPAADPEDPLHEVLDAGASALAPDDEPAHEHDGTSDVGDSGSDVVADSGEHFDDLRDAGAPSGAVGGVQLRAVVTEVSDGASGIAGEWTNGLDEPIFLQGCSTTSGWYRDGNEWIENGGFVLCFAEGPMVVVGPGEVYVDFAGVPPANRGTNTWRLQGSYGVGCVPAEGLFSESQCAAVTEIISENEVTVAQ